MKQTRKGYGKGLGMGYKNLVPLDPYIHSLSAKGVKSKNRNFRPDYKYWAWWDNLSKQEQEKILKKVYIMQEQNIWAKNKYPETKEYKLKKKRIMHLKNLLNTLEYDQDYKDENVKIEVFSSGSLGEIGQITDIKSGETYDYEKNYETESLLLRRF